MQVSSHYPPLHCCSNRNGRQRSSQKRVVGILLQDFEGGLISPSPLSDHKGQDNGPKVSPV